MSDGSKIEWTDATVNAINGCSVVSPGCTNCYAMRLAGTRMKNHPSRQGLTIDTKAGPVWNGAVRLHEPALLQPLRWRRPRTIFWNAHGDTFHPDVPDDWIDRMFAVMALTPHHKHLVLTKRADRMREYMLRGADRWTLSGDDWEDIAVEMTGSPCAAAFREDLGWPLPNVWLGVSAEDQARADERIPHLLATPAAGRFLSCEPLLGPIDLARIAPGQKLHGAVSCEHVIHALQGGVWDQLMRVRDTDGPRIDGIIVGGESGTGARPMHPDWARSLRDQCAAAGVDFHFKQWGEWVPDVGAVDGWTINDDPECSKYEHRDWEGDHFGEPYARGWMDDVEPDTVSRVGKKQAGRHLDGVTHDALPWTRQ